MRAFSDCFFLRCRISTTVLASLALLAPLFANATADQRRENLIQEIAAKKWDIEQWQAAISLASQLKTVEEVRDALAFLEKANITSVALVESLFARYVEFDPKQASDFAGTYRGGDDSWTPLLDWSHSDAEAACWYAVHSKVHGRWLGFLNYHVNRGPLAAMAFHFARQDLAKCLRFSAREDVAEEDCFVATTRLRQAELAPEAAWKWLQAEIRKDSFPDKEVIKEAARGLGRKHKGKALERLDAFPPGHPYEMGEFETGLFKGWAEQEAAKALRAAFKKCRIELRVAVRFPQSAEAEVRLDFESLLVHVMAHHPDVGLRWMESSDEETRESYWHAIGKAVEKGTLPSNIFLPALAKTSLQKEALATPWFGWGVGADGGFKPPHPSAFLPDFTEKVSAFTHLKALVEYLTARSKNELPVLWINVISPPVPVPESWQMLQKKILFAAWIKVDPLTAIEWRTGYETHFVANTCYCSESEQLLTMWARADLPRAIAAYDQGLGLPEHYDEGGRNARARAAATIARVWIMEDRQKACSWLVDQLHHWPKREEKDVIDAPPPDVTNLFIGLPESEKAALKSKIEAIPESPIRTRILKAL